MNSSEPSALRDWETRVLNPALEKAPETHAQFQTASGLPVSRLSVPAALDSAYLEKGGFPGAFPFTRGIHPTMYRSRLWTMRQYAGFGTAADTNARFHELLNEGMTGLSVAFDLPTQIGLDSDHPLSRGEVGKVGVAIDSLADMETLFQGIPLDQVSTSMTINAPAAVLLAMYVVLAEKQGLSRSQVRGTVQNDILKEYVARGTFIFPPRPSLALAGELIAWCSRELPRFNPISISGYHIREAGSTAPQEIALTFVHAISYLECALAHGLTVDQVAPRLSFFFCSASDLFEEVAKFRAARRLWARLMRDRFGAKRPDSMALRFHAQTAGHTLTAQQVDNNITRVSLQALAAVLGGAQSIHTNAKDEALALPSPENAETALRVQQILASETGVTNTVDPLGGSFHVESLTDSMEAAISGIMEEVARAGDAVQAIESGLVQRMIDESAFRRQRAIETGDQIVVGVNRYQSAVGTRPTGQSQCGTPSGAGDQVQRLSHVRKTRDGVVVRRCLESIADAARSKAPLVPGILEAVRGYATVGEICGSLRSVYGEHTS